MIQLEYIRFDKLSSQGRDGTCLLFEFSAIEEKFLNTPEEDSKRFFFPVECFISRTLMINWGFRSYDEDFQKIVFEYAKRFIISEVEKGTFQNEYKIVFNTTSYPQDCPFNPKKINNALNQIFSTESKNIKLKPRASDHPYICEERIKALQETHNPDFDLTKLIKFAKELNIAKENSMYFSIIFLVRTILNHVSPIWGFPTFKTLLNNGQLSNSFKEICDRLENTSRKIADSHIHQPITKAEDLPTFQQVNFEAEIDFLLMEALKKLRT